MKSTQRSLKSSVRVEPAAFSRSVSSRLGDAAGPAQLEHDRVVITVDKSRVVDVVRTLKTDPELNCNYFTFLSAVDWQDEGFEVLIVLYSTVNLNTVVIRVRLPKLHPSMPTITGVYGGAHWHERECAEMFGIDFEGHPYLKNLYLPDDFEGHPLLKSFKLASRTYKPWPGAKDPEEAAGGGR